MGSGLIPGKIGEVESVLLRKRISAKNRHKKIVKHKDALKISLQKR